MTPLATDRAPTSIRLTPTGEDHRIARLAALAIGLSLAEAAIPSPVPGVKPGLANIVTLVVLERYGLRTAAWVSLLRVVAGSILLGTFLSPTFLMSLAGALASLAALIPCQVIPARLLGPVGKSIVAALAHIGGQLVVAWAWLIPGSGLLYLAPPLAAAAVVFGVVNGVAAAGLLSGRASDSGGGPRR